MGSPRAPEDPRGPPWDPVGSPPLWRPKTPPKTYPKTPPKTYPKQLPKAIQKHLPKATKKHLPKRPPLGSQNHVIPKQNIGFGYIMRLSNYLLFTSQNTCFSRLEKHKTAQSQAEGREACACAGNRRSRVGTSKKAAEERGERFQWRTQLYLASGPCGQLMMRAPERDELRSGMQLDVG